MNCMHRYFAKNMAAFQNLLFQDLQSCHQECLVKQSCYVGGTNKVLKVSSKFNPCSQYLITSQTFSFYFLPSSRINRKKLDRNQRKNRATLAFCSSVLHQGNCEISKNRIHSTIQQRIFLQQHSPPSGYVQATNQLQQSGFVLQSALQFFSLPCHMARSGSQAVHLPFIVY